MAFRSGAAPRRKGGKDVFEPLEVYPALVLNNHLGAINQIILHQNTLVTSSSDGKITIWDYDRKAVIHEFRGDSKRLFLRGSLLFCVAFGAFGNEPGEVNVYNFKKKQFVCSYRGHTLFITDCILFEDVIVTASADQTVRVWDAVVNFEDAPAKPEERASRRILQGHSGIVNCLLWSGGYVWSGSADQTVKAWNMQTANCAVTLTGHTGSVICLETSKDLIYSGGADSTIRTWDPRNGTCISTIKLKGSITQLIHHTDHLFCLTSTETAITQVHPRSGKVIKRLEGHTGKVLTMKATLHNLYTGSEDGFVRRWSIKNGTCWAVLRGHKDRIHSLLSANASSLLSGSADTNTVFWDILRHDDEVPADVDEEEKWFVKMKAQDLKEQELYANLIKQRLNAQKSPANILAPPPALVPPPTLVVPTAGAAPVAPPPAAAAAASPAAASPAPKRDEKVSALAFLSEPVTAAAKPAKDKERKNSAAATGSNRSSGASPMRDRAATGHTYASWAAVVEAASIDSSEVAQCAKLPLADAHKLTVDDYVHVGVKHPNAQRLVRLFAP